MLALGSLRAYLRSAWNSFDLLIITLGYVSYIDIGDSANGVRALRGLRALRPLRTMSRFQILRAIVICFLTVRLMLLLLEAFPHLKVTRSVIFLLQPVHHASAQSSPCSRSLTSG